MRYLSILIVLGLLVSLTWGTAGAAESNDRPLVLMTTTHGEIEIELWPEAAPETVRNFLQYVESGHYNGLIFHRVIRDFVIQGGGFDVNLAERATRLPIANEADPAIRNLRGTLSMARADDPDSAASQFFINILNNFDLDATDTRPGYCVFGKVSKGMRTVETINRLPVGSRMGHEDVPLEDVVILSATRLK
ncbi:peptidyl-prolyl cis-trans isomerase cyclophilin type [Alkalidesulfovibrio alkalitolerans DSM 16529]|uniref:Peptidyl-prolyl cis-trans isomerase n=1 Tax=Alkalidesulfovibrio alkalitolerans DSM 16529 TaxID=1121439 RepID=S7TEW9_9BACT|nr:peptidylprolyl isomerase [Alkalidesulfovibrio alkalitolerans]EPR35727.1 peptidyl-prolyl cis-trans isomerase cyclophilin type [Alkalidesulfovibrio alkalitolerans DSM 16529]